MKKLIPAILNLIQMKNFHNPKAEEKFSKQDIKAIDENLKNMFNRIFI